jgi:hypothetical protein
MFISYTHESPEHKARVHTLADRLRQDGMMVVLDRDCDPGGPSEGWDKWSENQAAECEVFLPVFTESYKRCWDGEQPPGVRLGVIHEAKILGRRIFEAGQTVDFCRVVVFDEADKAHVPMLIAGLQIFHASWDYAALLGWLGLSGAAQSSASQPTPISWPAPLPYPSHQLADRVNEFRLFESIITGRSYQRILLLKGLSNSGKTALLSELFKLAKFLGLDHAKLDFKGCPTLDEIFDILALDVRPGVLPSFQSALGTARKKTALLRDLQTLHAPFVLGFDTFQEASKDSWDWIDSQLLGRAERFPGFVAVLSGQILPNPSPHIWGGLAAFCELPPIRSEDDWHHYVCEVLGRTGITFQHLQMLMHVTGGDPGKTSTILRSFVPPSHLSSCTP